MQGKLIIFSAPSGAGKTTIVRHILKVFPELEFSVSACSRPMRKNEIPGVDYYFLSIDDFKEKIANDEFLEWEEVYPNNFYGTLKSEIFRIWENGKHVIFDIDVEGSLNLKKKFGGESLAIFVMPPSIQHLEERLKSRKTETPENIAKRVNKAEMELKTASQFDKIILNDNLEQAFLDAEKIVGDFINVT